MGTRNLVNMYHIMKDQFLNIFEAAHELNRAMGHAEMPESGVKGVLAVIAEATRKLNAVRAVINGESE